MTVPPTPDPLREALVATLERVADTVPATTPTWDGVRAGMREVRRRRRLRLAGRVTAGVLAVGCTLAGLQLGVLPYPGWAPAVTLPADGSGESALSRQPTKGSLADDASWLRALRAEVSRFDQDEGGGVRWRVTSADRIRVIFAGDVGAHRLALVEAPVRFGLLQTRLQVWYAGPRGAAPAQLGSRATDAPHDVASVLLQDLPDATPSAPTLVVLAAGEPSVQVAGPPTVGPDGSVRWSPRRLTAVEPGLWTDVEPLPARIGTRYVRIGGEPWTTLPTGWSLTPDRDAAVRSLPGAVHRSSAAVDAAGVEFALGELDWVVGPGSVVAGADGALRTEPAPTPGLAVLWRGPMAGWTVQAVTVQAPGGGRLVAVHQENPVPNADGAVMSRTTVLTGPDRSPDLLTVAFQLDPPQYRGDHPPATAVGLIGPAQATVALVTDAAGLVHEVPLVDGVGSAPVANAVRAQFRDAAGRTVADVPVATVSQGLPLPPT